MTKKTTDNITVRDIILWNRIGRMIPLIAQRFNWSIKKSFDVFFRSQTLVRLRDESTGLYLYGERYIIEDLAIELGLSDYSYPQQS